MIYNSTIVESEFPETKQFPNQKFIITINVAAIRANNYVSEEEVLRYIKEEAQTLGQDYVQAAKKVLNTFDEKFDEKKTEKSSLGVIRQ